MLLVYLNPSGSVGGAEVALLNILAGIKEAQPAWKLHLIVSADGVLAAKAKSLGVTTTVLPFPPSLARIGDASASGPAGAGTGRLRVLSRLLWANGDIRDYVEQLRSLLREINPEIIHTNGFKMHILGALAKPAGVPLIWHIHDYVSQRPFMVRLMKRFKNRCAIALANSNSVKRDIQSVCGAGLPTKTIYNGIDTTVFAPDAEALDLDLLSGLSPAVAGTVRVGLFATFARWKGHEVFLRALSLIPRDVPVRGYIVGDALYQTDGSQYSLIELQELAQALGVSDRVGFTGFVDQPAAAMRAVDVVVHASTRPEPFGLVIVEAMACARAVIVSAAGGAAELVEANIDALVHRPGDAAQLAELIKQLAADAELRDRLGRAGRVTATTRFDRSRLASELVPIYSEVRSQKSEVRSQKSEIRGRRSERSRTDAN